MKKAQRILALIGVILLVAMYASTLIFALFESSATMGLFKASIACTIFVPVMIYAMTLFYKLVNKDSSDEDDDGKK